jgi:hypothetical protein
MTSDEWELKIDALYWDSKLEGHIQTPKDRGLHGLCVLLSRLFGSGGFYVMEYNTSNDKDEG